VRTWVLAIARHQAYTALRRQLPPLAGEEALDTLPDNAPGCEETALAELEYHAILAAIARLTCAQRLVILLAFVDGLSYAEIAAALHLPLGTVKRRVCYGKRALRGLLTQSGVVQ
jgi:RNA polymerase sigma-70 factor (ECF subfamily)